jgi:hypothetical protein
MTQFVEFTRFMPQDETNVRTASPISVNVTHVTAIVPHATGGTLLRFVGSSESEHICEDYIAVMRTLNR